MQQPEADFNRLENLQRAKFDRLNAAYFEWQRTGKFTHRNEFSPYEIEKDNLFDVPPLFKTIHEQSHTDYQEMYKVFNMGHRMEVYVPENLAEQIISISKSFNVDAKIIGRVEKGNGKSVTVKSEFGEFKY